MNSSSPVNNIEDALYKLVYVFHNTYGGMDKDRKYIINGEPKTAAEVLMMGNSGNSIVNC